MVSDFHALNAMPAIQNGHEPISRNSIVVLLKPSSVSRT